MRSHHDPERNIAQIKSDARTFLQIRLTRKLQQFYPSAAYFPSSRNKANSPADSVIKILSTLFPKAEKCK